MLGQVRNCHCCTWTPCACACVESMGAGGAGARAGASARVRLVPSLLLMGIFALHSAGGAIRRSLPRPPPPSFDRCRRIYHSFSPRLCDGGSNTFPPSRFLTGRSLDLYDVTRRSGDRLHVKNIAHWEHAIREVGVGRRRELVTLGQILDFSLSKCRMRPTLIDGLNSGHASCTQSKAE